MTYHAAHDAVFGDSVPASAGERLLLFAIRRMAAGGLNDAIAAQALITAFGLSFRRPLILLRAFMAETARVSAVRLTVAPQCCRRVTHGERALLEAIGGACADPAACHAALSKVLHVRHCLGVVTSAQAVGACFTDLGLPIPHDCA